jgi:hypothetical protein
MLLLMLLMLLLMLLLLLLMLIKLEGGNHVAYNMNDMNARVKNFMQEYCGAKEGEEVPLGLLAEMAYCLGLDLNISLLPAVKVNEDELVAAVELQKLRAE